MAVDEIGRRHALLALQLHFEHFERASRPATYNQPTTLYQHFSSRRGMLDWLRCPEVEVLSPKTGVRARPGLKATQAVKNFLGGQAKINLAVFFLQDGRQCRFGMVLWPGLNRPGLESAQGFNHKVGAGRSHSRR